MNTTPDHRYERDSSPFLGLTRGLFHFLHTSSNRESGIAARQLSLAPLGTLHVPSGRLVAEDPFRSLRPFLNRFFEIPPGSYRAVQTLAQVGEDGQFSQSRVAYLSLILNEEALQSRRRIQKEKIASGEDPQIDPRLISPLLPELPNDSLSQRRRYQMSQPRVPILTGTIALTDQESFERLMPSDQYDRNEGWLENVFEHGVPGSWFDALDSQDPWPVGSANVQLPGGTVSERVVLCQTGWGDGNYAVVKEQTDEGIPVALHIDFGVIPSDPMLDLRD